MDSFTRGADPIGYVWVPQILDTLRSQGPIPSGKPVHPSTLKSVLGAGAYQELLSLQEEDNPEIFFQDLTHLALCLAGQSREAPAHGLLVWLESNGDNYLKDSTAKKEILGRVHRERLALEGQGPVAYQLEHLSRRFLKEVCDPAMIGGMMVAGPLSQTVRAGSLRTLLNLRSVPLVSAGVGARLTAASLAFAVEVPAFLATSKAIRTWTNGPQDWSYPTLKSELQSLAIGLFFLKSFGRLGNRLEAWQRGLSPFFPGNPSALNWAMMYGGVILGHQVQVERGLRPGQPIPNTLLESLLFLVQIQAGGQISRTLMGETLVNKLHQLEVQSEILSQQKPPPPFWGIRAFQPAFAVAGWGGEPWEISPDILMMEGRTGNGSGPRQALARTLRENLSRRHQVDPENELLDKVVKNFSETSFTINPEKSQETYFNFLNNHPIRDVQFRSGGRVTSLEILRYSTAVYRHVLNQEAFRRGTGSFYDHLVQVAFERALEENNRRALADLSRLVTYKRTVRDLEDFFKDQGWHYRYQARQGIFQLTLQAPKWRQQLDQLGLPKSLRNSLAGYLMSYSLGRDARAFRHPDYNYLLLQRTTGSAAEEPMQASFALRSLQRVRDRTRQWGDWIEVLKQVAQRGKDSSIPLLYYDRLFKVVATGGLVEKVLEVSDDTQFHWGWLQNTIRQDPGPNFYQSAARIDGRVYTGYVQDVEVAEKLARFYHRVPAMLDPQVADAYRAEFLKFAEGRLGNKANFEREDVIELLFHRPTRIARLARADILKGEVDFRLVSEAEIKRLAADYQNDAEVDSAPEGIFIPAHRSPSGKPLIAIKEIDPNASRNQKLLESVYLAAFTVHEYQHYLDHNRLGAFTASTQLISEMRAWTEENIYLVQQGEMAVWQEAEMLSPQGFGVHLRKLIDLSYLEGPRDLVIQRK